MGAPWKITENMVKNFNISVVVEGSMGKSKDDHNSNPNRKFIFLMFC